MALLATYLYHCHQPILYLVHASTPLSGGKMEVRIASFAISALCMRWNDASPTKHQQASVQRNEPLVFSVHAYILFLLACLYILICFRVGVCRAQVTSAGGKLWCANSPRALCTFVFFSVRVVFLNRLKPAFKKCGHFELTSTPPGRY